MHLVTDVKLLVPCRSPANLRANFGSERKFFPGRKVVRLEGSRVTIRSVKCNIFDACVEHVPLFCTLCRGRFEKMKATTYTHFVVRSFGQLSPHWSWKFQPFQESCNGENMVLAARSLAAWSRELSFNARPEASGLVGGTRERPTWSSMRQ